MLGLRPRLKTRPSLLDLIQKKDIDHISAAVEQATHNLATHDYDPALVPLPSSPVISPLADQLAPPPHTAVAPTIVVHRDSESDDDTQSDTMPPKAQKKQEKKDDGEEQHGMLS